MNFWIGDIGDLPKLNQEDIKPNQSGVSGQTEAITKGSPDRGSQGPTRFSDGS
jgi:hypothetical protein